MTKLNWDRKPNETYDAGVDVEWRRGPSEVSFERPDGSENLDLLAPPTVYWAKEMRRAFPDDTDEAHVRLFDAAWRAAVSIYYRLGWNVVRPRIEAIHAKASARNSFPSAYYAVYFDYCILNVAKYDHWHRGVALPKTIERLGGNGYPYSRARGHCRPLVERVGFKGFETYLSELRAKVIEFRGWNK